MSTSEPRPLERGVAGAAGWRSLEDLSVRELVALLERRGLAAVRLELERRRQAQLS